MTLRDRIKDRARQLENCPHEKTHVENDRRFGQIIVCDACDQVVDRLGAANDNPTIRRVP